MLGEIPALIIDDESDQASVNTTNPKKWEEGAIERTAINDLISQLLELLPRAQYVGYTATPFANVFVDPGDADDIFPRDFILSLDRAPGYMGVPRLPRPRVAARRTRSRRSPTRTRRHSSDRSPMKTPRHALQEALDAFVLTGAIKLYREPQEARTAVSSTTRCSCTSRSAGRARDLADAIRDLWRTAGYYGARRPEAPRGCCSTTTSSGHGRPRGRRALSRPAFADVKPFIGRSRHAGIEGSANDPVLIVNGDKDAAKEDVDFDRRRLEDPRRRHQAVPRLHRRGPDRLVLPPQ